ncbi:hypothetical protein V4R08_07135 [Nitrobacter sp. NHB1]|uniref:hypothetical protein n=1 Tax=Nitrobacter sp. NHB1 TaxID=3119830 RepID=UPI002FFF06F3
MAVAAGGGRSAYVVIHAALCGFAGEISDERSVDIIGFVSRFVNENHARKAG